MDGDTVRNALLGLTALVTAMTPILLAMINKKQQRMLENSNEAKDAAVTTASKVEEVKTAATTTAGKVEQVRVQAEKASGKVEAVAVELATQGAHTKAQLEEIAKTGQDTHILVNSAMGEQLRLGMDLSAFKAATTGDPKDIAAANLARGKYEAHLKKQEEVDAKMVTIQGKMLTPREDASEAPPAPPVEEKKG